MGGIALLKAAKVVHVSNYITLRPLLIPPLLAHEIKSCLSNKHAPSANIAAVSPCASQASQAAVHSAAAPAPAPRHHPGTPVRRSRVEGVCPRPGEPKPALSGGLHCAMTGQPFWDHLATCLLGLSLALL